MTVCYSMVIYFQFLEPLGGQEWVGRRPEARGLWDEKGDQCMGHVLATSHVPGAVLNWAERSIAKVGK